MSEDIGKGRRSSVYVLPHLRNGRRSIPVRSKACRQILEEHYERLPGTVRGEFDTYLSQENQSLAGTLRWARLFYRDYTRGAPSVPARIGPRVSRDDRDSWTTAMVALAHVIDAGATGVTAAEIKRSSGVISDGISGSLSTLAKSGVVLRLEERR